ncbi:hypothetical protein ACQEVF_24295 [Nonomuraea polychroma]|uniref:hypothetical protein n=1 Tax=Nonomuraea polychroma TaxID=46176 RepID=UPI003D8D5672
MRMDDRARAAFELVTSAGEIAEGLNVASSEIGCAASPGSPALTRGSGHPRTSTGGPHLTVDLCRAQSAVRGYQAALRFFCDYVTEPRSGWPAGPFRIPVRMGG